jgi:quercetin dioxygenase-like cupin family protein
MISLALLLAWSLTATPPLLTHPFLTLDTAPTFVIAGGKASVTMLSETPNYLGRLVAQPGAAVPEHVHDTSDELIYVLSGAGEMRLEGAPGPIPVTPGMGIQIRRGLKHAFEVPADAKEPLVVVQVYTPAGPEQRFKAPPPK